jgi:cell division transport system permease protein
VSPAQRQRIKQALESNPEVREGGVFYETQQQAYDRYQQIYKDSATADIVEASDLQASFRVSLKDPQQYQGVMSAVQGLPGVFSVQDTREVLEPLFAGLNGMQWISIGLAGGLLVAGVLQISNTIRLTVFSRRREISIMRLVGASNFYIQLPFIVESMIAALVGAAMACATLAFTPLVTDRLRDDIRVVPWIGWEETITVMPVLAGVGMLLAVAASVVTLRKYLSA